MTDAAWVAALASAERIVGWYTFLHHDEPIEWTADLAERLRYIDKEKPAHEQAARRRCIVAVPAARLPAGYGEAWRAYDEAGRVYVEAGRAAQGELLALALSLVPDAPWVDGALRFLDSAPAGVAR